MSEQRQSRGRVLVTGASIAGPTAAGWLARAGFDVTVLEAAERLRPGGQNVDVRGTGREVLRRTGIEDAVRARGTGEVGTRFVAEDGSTVAEVPVDDSDDRDGPTAELEILRGALSQVVVDSCPDSVTWRFGARVESVAQDDDGVDVVLSDGEHERYDLLVVAEGVGSHTRDLVFGEAEEEPLGMYMAFATLDRTAQDDDWWNWLTVAGGRQAHLRPDDEGTTRAMLTFLADEPLLDGLAPGEVVAELRRRFDGVGWEVPRILDGFEDADDLYVDFLRQVRCPTWHHGRVVLLGDAAWCVTPLGGVGAALGLTGGYVLAAHLSQARPGEHEAAFARYEEHLRPMVDQAQDLPPGVPRAAAPRSQMGVRLLRAGLKVAASGPVQSLVSRLSSGPETERDLPEVVAAAS